MSDYDPDAPLTGRQLVGLATVVRQLDDRLTQLEGLLIRLGVIPEFRP